MDNTNLEQLLGEKGRELVPEDLASNFDKECADIVLEMSARIERVMRACPHQAIDLEREAEESIKKWVKEKFDVFAYGRYKKLMEEQGREPYAFKQFRCHADVGSGKTALYYFRVLEKKGFKVGQNVVYDKKGAAPVYKIHAIMRNCMICLFDEENGQCVNGVSPLGGKLLEEGETTDEEGRGHGGA